MRCLDFKIKREKSRKVKNIRMIKQDEREKRREKMRERMKE